MRSWSGRALEIRAGICLLALSLVVAGCGEEQSTLDPQSHAARSIEKLFWGMLAAAAIVFAGTLALLAIAWARRNREGLPLIGQEPAVSKGLVIAFGIVIPVLALGTLFFISDIGVVRATEAPEKGETAFTVEVTGHQWWWEFRYPNGAVTANEMHIPAKTHVRVRLTTTDVIHSFWAPQLNRKIDAIPDHPNEVDIYAAKAGVYRGECAEYCGLQHAHMAFAVHAEPRDDYERWLENMAAPRAEPKTADQREGEQVFLDNCAACHTIRGSDAKGQVGPDLTHLQTRKTLAALTIPNRKGYLGGWVLDPQHVKPGAKMPGLNLSGEQFNKLLAYLENLK